VFDIKVFEMTIVIHLDRVGNLPVMVLVPVVLASLCFWLPHVFGFPIIQYPSVSFFWYSLILLVQ